MPTTAGDVVRVAFRHAVVTPPLRASASLMDADASPAHDDHWHTALVPALQEMGCCVLDPRFAACADVCNSAAASEVDGAEGGGEEARLVRKLRVSADLGQLRPGNLSPGGKETLLAWLAQRATAPGDASQLRAADVEFLRTLPLYPTLAGRPAAVGAGGSGAATSAALGAVAPDVVAAVAGSQDALPPALQAQLLQHRDDLSALYRQLAVPLLAAPAMLAALLRWEGGFARLSAPAQTAALRMIETHWSGLQDDPACVEAMAAAAFVATADGGGARPNATPPHTSAP